MSTDRNIWHTDTKLYLLEQAQKLLSEKGAQSSLEGLGEELSE